MKHGLMIALLAMGLVTGCAPDAVQPSSAEIATASQEIAQTPAPTLGLPDRRAAEATLQRVEARLRTAATQVCREKGGTSCRWRVEYRHDPVFNAFASGEDQIVMYGGLFAAARNEADIAMVLAHEQAHHILDHIAETNRNAGIGAFIADILIVVGAQWLAQELGLPLPPQLVSTARQTASGAGAKAGVLAFSVANEKEADALSAEIMRRAGYNPQDARGMLLAMGALSRGDSTPRFLRTHPAGPERLAHWDSLATGKTYATTSASWTDLIAGWFRQLRETWWPSDDLRRA
jgi:Zn-dependent protease with chaperone function